MHSVGHHLCYKNTYFGFCLVLIEFLKDFIRFNHEELNSPFDYILQRDPRKPPSHHINTY